MTENREVGIDRVEQPEVGNVRSRKIRQALILLPTAAGKLSATGGKNLDQSAQNPDEIFTGAGFDQRRNIARIQMEGAGLGPLHVGDAQHRAAFATLRLG